MMHRVETTDPITGRDIKDTTGKPFVVDSGPEDELTIYFESEESKRQFLEIPVEHPVEHRLNLDNPTDIMIDEG
jgi:YHS domain-containing protein